MDFWQLFDMSVLPVIEYKIEYKKEGRDVVRAENRRAAEEQNSHKMI